MHPAVTYVYVSSLGCKCSFLGLQAFSSLWQSVDFVNILTGREGPVSKCQGAGVALGATEGLGLAVAADCGL